MKQNIRFKVISLLLIISMVFSLSGCFLTDPLNESIKGLNEVLDNKASAEDNQEFDEYMKELFAQIITEDAVSVHSFMENPKDFGIEDYELTLGRVDMDKLDDTTELTDIIAKIKSFDRSTLSEKQQITYDEMLQYMENELEYADLYLFNTSLDTTTGIHIQLPLIMAEYSFTKKSDIDEYLEILSDVDGYFENILEFETLRAKNGFFMEDKLADEVIESCNTFVKTADGEEGVLVQTFAERLESFNSNVKNSDDKLTDSEIAAYKTKNAAVIKEHVIPGYTKLAEGLKGLKGTNKYKGGLCNYPLQSTLGWDKSVEELDELVDSYNNKYMRTMQKLFFTNPSLSSKLEDFSFNMTDPVEILEDLKKRIPDDFPEIDDVDYEIKYISKALEDSASPAMYFIPQLDNLDVNSIYINQSDKNTNELYPTLAHEGYPGHLYQTQYFANTNPEWIRYIMAPGGYVEGWATYIEVQSYKYAQTGDEALNELYSANYATVLTLYAKCDIGVNYYGWSEDDVLSYISKFGFNDESVASEMYYAFISNPGNYCKYILGMIGFEELKAEAMDELDEAFVLKDFHKFVLDMGPVQFDILFEHLPAWIKEQKNHIGL